MDAVDDGATDRILVTIGCVSLNLDVIVDALETTESTEWPFSLDLLIMVITENKKNYLYIYICIIIY